MVFEIYLKKEVGNNISHIIGIGIKSSNVDTLDISGGFLTKGDYRIPIQHILFIKEV